MESFKNFKEKLNNYKQTSLASKLADKDIKFIKYSEVIKEKVKDQLSQNQLKAESKIIRFGGYADNNVQAEEKQEDIEPLNDIYIEIEKNDWKNSFDEKE